MKPIDIFRDALPCDFAGSVQGDAEAGALFGCGTVESAPHRYALWRVWDAELPVLVWCLLNPSTATHAKLDPTIRRCIAWARLWGCGGVLIVNAYAFRSKDQDVMLRAPNRVGEFNDQFLAHAFAASRAQATPALAPGTLMVAWGAGIEHDREARIIDVLLDVGVPTYCLGRTRRGQPRHPVRLAYATPTELWP